MGGTNIFHATLVISHATNVHVLSCVSRTCAQRHCSWTTSGTDGGHGLHCTVPEVQQEAVCCMCLPYDQQWLAVSRHGLTVPRQMVNRQSG